MTKGNGHLALKLSMFIIESIPLQFRFCNAIRCLTRHCCRLIALNGSVECFWLMSLTCNIFQVVDYDVNGVNNYKIFNSSYASLFDGKESLWFFSIINYFFWKSSAIIFFLDTCGRIKSHFYCTTWFVGARAKPSTPSMPTQIIFMLHLTISIFFIAAYKVNKNAVLHLRAPFIPYEALKPLITSNTSTVAKTSHKQHGNTNLLWLFSCDPVSELFVK